LRALDILVVNEGEAAWLANRLGCVSTSFGLAEALGINVVRSLGSEGLEAHGPLGAVRLPSHPASVVDTSAAGDCLVGVLAAALENGLSWTHALMRANRAAALCCSRAGTQSALPTRKEIDNAL
jgi:ribokinase